MIVSIMAFAVWLPVGTCSAQQPVDEVKAVQETPESGEIQRTKFVNGEGEVLRREISRQDETELITYGDKGTMSYRTLTRTGVKPSKSFFEYFSDGKLKLEKVDGVVRFERRKLADGTYEAIRFKSDGVRPQMRRRVGPNGGFELTHYRPGPGSTVYFTATVQGVSSDFEWQYFNKDGSHLRRVQREKEMVVTVYDKSGNFLLEQVWLPKKDGTYIIASTAVRTGSELRRYTVDEHGKLISSEIIDLDGSVKVKEDVSKIPAPAPSLFKEQYESDDPTVPGSPLVPH